LVSCERARREGATDSTRATGGAVERGRRTVSYEWTTRQSGCTGNDVRVVRREKGREAGGSRGTRRIVVPSAKAESEESASRGGDGT